MEREIKIPTPQERVQRVLAEVFDDSNELNDNQFNALGDYATGLIFNRDFEEVRELWRGLTDRTVRGGYSTEDTARLKGIADVVGNAMKYKPATLNQDEFDLLTSASRGINWRMGIISEEEYRLAGRGLLVYRRFGGINSVEITPRGIAAAENFSANLPREDHEG